MTDTLPVTLVTQNASQDSPDDFYMEELMKLWNGPAERKYPKLMRLLGEPVKRKAWWHHRIKGTRTTFGPNERSMIRAAVDNGPPVQPSVTAVTDAMVHPDAAMFLVGTLEPGERVERVLMLADSREITIHANGAVTATVDDKATQRPTDAWEAYLALDKPQAQETPQSTNYGRYTANRAPVYRPVFSTDEKERFESFGGLRRIIDAGVKALREDGR